LTALALVAEIGDFNRFRTAEEFMAFVGLVPSERSSGEHRRQGSITKVGNSHARRQRGPGRRPDRAVLTLPATALPTLAADGWPGQTAPEDRRRLRS
jgi:hypothetical protein